MKYFALFSIFISAAAHAVPTISIEKDKSSVEFLAIGRPSALKIRGNKAKPEGKITFKDNGIDGIIVLNLEDFETGISLRDRHMKEKYLETAREDFKNVKLTLAKIELPKTYWKNPIPIKIGFEIIDCLLFSSRENKLDSSFLSFKTSRWNRISGVKAIPKRKLKTANVDKVSDNESTPFASK